MGPGRRLAVLFAALAGAACVLLPAAPASAHASLVGASPQNGTVVPTAPTSVSLTFNEPVNVSLGRVTVLDPDGKKVQDGKPTQRRSGAEVVQKLAGGLRRGTYVVSYRVVSADGHPISGSVVFSFGAPSRRGANGEVTGGADINPVVRTLYTLSRYTGYVGLSLLVGAVLVLLALWPRRLPSGGPRRLLWAGWGLLVGATVGSVILQVPYGTGGPVTDVRWGELVSTAGHGVGAAQVLRVALLLAAIPVLRRVVAGRAETMVDKVALWALFGLTLLTWPMSGHAAASPGRLLSIPVDAIHVGAASVWLGGLLVLSRFLLPSAKVGEIALILPVWSRWALDAIVAIAVTGSAQAMIEVGTLRALTGTDYGRLVLAKIAGLAAIVAIASFSRRWVQTVLVGAGHSAAEPPAGAARQPADSTAAAGTVEARNGAAAAGISATEVGDGAAVKTAVAVTAEPTADEASTLPRIGLFRRALLAELAVGAVVLGLASALVQAVPGVTATAPPADEAAPTGEGVSMVLKTDKLSLQVQLDPAATGNNSVHLYAFTPTGAPQQVQEWTGFAAQPEKGVDKVEVPLLPITANHAVGDVSLPTAGRWKLSFTLRTTDVDEVTLSRDVTIQ